VAKQYQGVFMARVRLIANEPRFIPLIQRLIEVDEAFEVDDKLFAERAWPEDTFEVLTDIKKEEE
jgi:hypothetical protein